MLVAKRATAKDAGCSPVRNFVRNHLFCFQFSDGFFERSDFFEQITFMTFVISVRICHGAPLIFFTNARPDSVNSYAPLLMFKLMYPDLTRA